MVSLSFALFLLLVLFCVFSVVTSARGLHLSSTTRNVVGFIGCGLVLVLSAVIYHQTFSTRYTDMVRMTHEMEMARVQGYEYLQEKYELYPLSALLLYVVSLTGDYDLLKSLSIVISLLSIFGIGRALRKMGGSRQLVFIVLLYILAFLDFSYPADTVRSFTAYSVFCFAIIWGELSTSRNKCILKHGLLLAATLLHISLLPIYLLYCLSGAKSNLLKKIVAILGLIYFYLLNISIDVVTRINANIGWKLQLYFNPEGQWYSATPSRMQALYMLVGLFFVIFLVFCNNYFEKRGFRSDIPSKYKTFVILSICYMAGSYPSDVTFSRMVPLVVMCSAPYLLEYLRFFNDGEILQRGVGRPLSLLAYSVVIVYIFTCFVLRGIASYADFYVLL